MQEILDRRLGQKGWPPRRARPARPACPRPRVGQLQRRGRERGQPRHRPAAGRLRTTCLSRGATARLRHRGPSGRHRRRRSMDLERRRRAVSRRHRNRRHLPCQAASVRRGQGPLRPRDGPGRAVGQGPACRVGCRPAPRPRRGAAHPCRDHARGAKVHSLCVREPTPHALSEVPGQAGMRWTVAGANAIIALRCCILSGRFEDFWERRAANAA